MSLEISLDDVEAQAFVTNGITYGIGARYFNAATSKTTTITSILWDGDNLWLSLADGATAMVVDTPVTIYFCPPKEEDEAEEDNDSSGI